MGNVIESRHAVLRPVLITDIQYSILIFTVYCFVRNKIRISYFVVRCFFGKYPNHLSLLELLAACAWCVKRNLYKDIMPSCGLQACSLFMNDRLDTTIFTLRNFYYSTKGPNQVSDLLCPTDGGNKAFHVSIKINQPLKI